MGLWRSPGEAGLPAVPPAALKKKRQSVEEQGGGWEWADVIKYDSLEEGLVLKLHIFKKGIKSKRV